MTKEELIYILEVCLACEDWIDAIKVDERTPKEIWEAKDYYPRQWVLNGPTGRHKATFEKSIPEYPNPRNVSWEVAKEILETDCLLYYACPEYLDGILPRIFRWN